MAESKRIEQALFESERRLSTLMGNLPGIAYRCLFDSQYSMEYISEGCISITGFEPSDFIGNKSLSFSDIIVPEYHEYLYKKWKEVLASRGIFTEEYRIKTKSGEEKWVWEQGCGIYSDDGEVIALEGFITDITPRKKAEMELEASEFRFRNLFEMLPVASYTYDRNGTIKQWNLACETLYGWSSEFAVGKNVCELMMRKENYQRAKENIAAIFQGNSFYNNEFEDIDTNGNRKVVLANEYPISDGSDNVILGLCAQVDITERKTRENSQKVLLKLAESGMSRLEELVPVLMDDLSRIADYDEFYIALHDWESDTLENLLPDRLSGRRKKRSIEGSLEGAVFKRGEALYVRESEFTHIQTEWKVEPQEKGVRSWLGVPLVTEGRTIGVMVILSKSNPDAYKVSREFLLLVGRELSISIERQRMIDQLIRAKEKAEESERIKSAFLANMSHEIRTPMNGILGFLELLKEPNLEQEERANYITVVNRSGERLLNTINDILEFSGIEAGGSPVILSNIGMKGFLGYFYDFFLPQATERGLELICNVPEIDTFISDKRKVNSIMTNLIRNAIKFTTTGRIEYGADSEDENIQFYVKDTGVGIKEEFRDIIFERFEQGDRRFSRGFEGTGLGLAISKGYVEALGGRLWLESEEGKGSTFYFSIPNRIPEKKLQI